MDDQMKIFRVFQLISRLRSPFGVTKNDLAQSFDVSERTIERYFALLRNLGFDIQNREKFFFIPRIEKEAVLPENLIVFSIEEAAAIRDAITGSTMQSPLQKTILTKLYALTDIDELSETLYKQNVSRNISKVRQAITSKTQVWLKAYYSVNSNTTCNRLVEPIRFESYYTYLLAYEVDSGMLKQYKTDRIGDVENTTKEWQSDDKHGTLHIDAFGMSGNQPIAVVLNLSVRAKSLMEEEHPNAIPHIKTSKQKVQFVGSVYALEGIGRFIMGLLDEIEIVSPPELKRYVEEKVRGWERDKLILDSL